MLSRQRWPLFVGLAALAFAPVVAVLQWQDAERSAAHAERTAVETATMDAAHRAAGSVASMLAQLERELDTATGNHAVRVRDYWYQRERDAPLNVVAALGAAEGAVNLIVDVEGRVIAANGADSVVRHERWFERTPRGSGQPWWVASADDAWQPTSLAAERNGGRARCMDAVALVRPVRDADGATIGWWRHVRPIDSFHLALHANDGAVALVDAHGASVLRLGTDDSVMPTDWIDGTPVDASASSIVTVGADEASASFACATNPIDAAQLRGGWRIVAMAPVAPMPSTARAAGWVIASAAGGGVLAVVVGWGMVRGRRRTDAVADAIVAATATPAALDAEVSGLEVSIVNALESWCTQRIDAACRTVDATAASAATPLETDDCTPKWSDALMSESDALEAASLSMMSSLGALHEFVTSMQSDHGANIEDVETLRQHADELLTQATATASSSRDASTLVDSSTEQVSELASAASEIGAVINVIEEIAEQTNLLALNATIESARAGDAGRGFAVVASEVKALARQTADATDDIRQRIEAIQATSGGALDAIGRIAHAIEVVHDVAASISGVAEAQHSVSDAVAVRLASSHSAFTRVQDATSEVEGVERDVLRVVDRLRDAAHQRPAPDVAGTIGTRPEEGNLAA